VNKGAAGPTLSSKVLSPLVNCERQGLPSQAGALYTQALDLLESHPEHDVAAKVLNNLAQLRRAEGRFAEAEFLYVRALDMQKDYMANVTRWLPSPCFR
jgi:hypothetical protein